MPKVPTYDTPQSTLAPLPGVRQNTVASPAMFGGRAQQMADAGKAMATAGGDIAAVGYQMQQKDDADSVFRAETALKDEYLQYEQEARKSRTGRFAKDLTKDTEKWFADRIKHHVGNLSNVDQRRVFSQRATRLRQQAAGSVSTWEASEVNKSLVEGAHASIAASVQLAAANPSPAAIENARLDASTNLRAIGATVGWTSEKLSGEILRATTMLHTQVIQGLARTDPVAAKAYFDMHKSEIDGTKHAEIGEFAQKVSATAVGERTADALWQTAGPKSDRDPVELDKLEGEIRKTLRGNEPAMHAAITALRERTQAFKDARRERDNALEAKVNDAILRGASRVSVARMPEFSMLSPETARRIDSYLENRDYTRAARASAEAQRADAEESRRQRRMTREGIEVAYRLSDPQVLARLSRNEVINLLPTLGPEHVGNLLQKWDSFAKSGDKLTEATIDKQLFNTVALEVGLRPNDSDEKMKDKLVRLQNHVEEMIGQEQRARGRSLTREEKGSVMRRELDKQVLVEGFVYNSTVRAPLATPAEVRKAIIRVEGREFKLSTIPQDDYDGLAEAARRRGLPITPELMAERWFELQRRRRAGEKVEKGSSSGSSSVLSSVEAKVINTMGDLADSAFRFPLGTLPRVVIGNPEMSTYERVMREQQKGPGKDKPMLPPMEGRHQVME